MTRISSKNTTQENIDNIREASYDVRFAIIDFIKYAMLDPEEEYEEDVTLDMAIENAKMNVNIIFDNVIDDINFEIKHVLDRI